MEWTEYFGDIPDLKSLEQISLSELPKDHLILIYLKLKILMGMSGIDPYMLPYEPLVSGIY